MHRRPPKGADFFSDTAQIIFNKAVRRSLNNFREFLKLNILRVTSWFGNVKKYKSVANRRRERHHMPPGRWQLTVDINRRKQKSILVLHGD